MKKPFYTALIVLFALLGLCSISGAGQSSNLTAGMAKSKITKNKTTQTELLDVFGAPNIVTKNKSGNEVWTYNQMAVDQSAVGGYGTVVLAGVAGSKSSASTRSFTLMIEFDENEVVKDFSYRSASF